MSLMITSEISKQYLQEEDAVEGFKIAVANNQLRLALEILTEIIDAFMGGFETLMPEQSASDTNVQESTVEQDKGQETPKKHSQKK
jgi:hypothetical protein